MMRAEPGSGSIFLIEDEPSIQEAMTYLMKLEGFEVDTANNGKDALEKLSDGCRPSLILMDLIMPEMGGEEFLTEIRKELGLAQIPVVVFTGDGDVKNKIKHLQVSEVILKPIDIDQVIGIAHKYCTPLPRAAANV